MYRFILPALLLAGGATALSADTKGYQARQAAADRVELDKALAGLVPGKPQDCIEPRLYPDTQRVGDTILYKNGRNSVLANNTGGGCYGLRQGDAIVTRSFTGRLCRGDIITTVDTSTGHQTGSCAFGDFIPYTRQ